MPESETTVSVKRLDDLIEELRKMRKAIEKTNKK